MTISDELTAVQPSGKISLWGAEQMLARIEEILSSETFDEAELDQLSEQYLEATSLADDAINRYAYLIEARSLRSKNRLAEAKNQRAIADGLKALAQQDENLVKRLKGRLMEFLDRRGVKKIETDRFKISVQNNGGDPPLIIDEEYSLADIVEHYPELLKVELDYAKVKEALKAGKELPFARFGERGRSLRIKP